MWNNSFWRIQHRKAFCVTEMLSRLLTTEKFSGAIDLDSSI